MCFNSSVRFTSGLAISPTENPVWLRWTSVVTGSKRCDLNTGKANHPMFVDGPWKASYGLGTYGVSGDSTWAVINYQGQFAIARVMR